MWVKEKKSDCGSAVLIRQYQDLISSNTDLKKLEKQHKIIRPYKYPSNVM